MLSFALHGSDNSLRTTLWNSSLGIKQKQSHNTPMEVQGERMYSSYSFTTSAQDGMSGQLLAPASLYPRGKDPPGNHWIGGWVGPGIGLDTDARGKILLPLPGVEPRSPGRPVRIQTQFSYADHILHTISYPVFSFSHMARL
jgi:hypothetical protein